MSDGLGWRSRRRIPSRFVDMKCIYQFRSGYPWSWNLPATPPRCAPFGRVLICLLGLAPYLAAESPSELLARAEKLADVYNWYDAEPLNSQAEAGFRALGDQRNALFAQANKLRGEMQIRPFPEVIDAIDSILAT